MIRRTASAVFLMRDGFTGATLTNGSATRCFLDGEPLRRPVWKREGYLVLTDLTPGEHVLLISRSGYQDERVPITVGDGRPMEDTIALKPGAGYRFPQETVRVELTLRRGGAPAAGERVWLGVPPRTRLKLAQEKNEPGDAEAHLFCDGNPGLLPIPGHFLMTDRKAPELAYLRSLCDETGEFAPPLTLSHGRGTEMIPMQSYCADESGVVRVLLTRLGLTDRMEVSLDGSYTLNELSFQRGSKVIVAISGGSLMVYYEGMALDAGKQLTLVRHAAENGKENGLRINGAYELHPGDLVVSIRDGQLRAVLHAPVEEYPLGVVPYEMSDSFPVEALKAQAIAARTYALRKVGSNQDYDVVDNTNDQAYYGVKAQNVNAAKAVKETDFYSPFLSMFKAGYSSLYYRGEGNIYDIILVNHALVADKGLKIQKINKKGFYGRVFHKDFMTNQSGQYKGTPFRTFSGGAWVNGYSDHYPTYIVVSK